MLPAQLYVIVAVHAFVPLPYFPHETVVPARYPNARQQVLKHNAVVQRVLANRGAIYGLGAESRFPGVIIAVCRKHHVVSCRSFIETNPVVPHQACGYHLRPRHSVLISQRFPIGILTYPAVIFLPGFHLPERIRVRALRPKNNHVVIRKGECIQHIQKSRKKEIVGIGKQQPAPLRRGQPAVARVSGSLAFGRMDNLRVLTLAPRKVVKIYNGRRTVIVYYHNLDILP